MKKTHKYFLIALAVIIVDQITKFIVKLNMQMGEMGQIKILGDLFKLHFIENRGAAFGFTVSSFARGLGIEMTEETGKLILSVFSIVAVVAIGYVLYKLADHKSPLPYYVALIFGGAMGNIIDRTFYGLWFSSINEYDGGLFHGRVVDMFYLDIWKGQLPEWLPIWGGDYTSLWPIFNIADSAISIGIVVILIFQGRFFRMDENARTAPSSDGLANIPDTKAHDKSPEVMAEQEPPSEEEPESPESSESDDSPKSDDTEE